MSNLFLNSLFILILHHNLVLNDLALACERLLSGQSFLIERSIGLAGGIRQFALVLHDRFCIISDEHLIDFFGAAFKRLSSNIGTPIIFAEIFIS